MLARYNALQIAHWFLAHNHVCISESGGEEISNLKLQKLLYYAQGAYLGIKGGPLFDDDILAWTHGPVVASVYHEYKEYGSNGIPYNPKVGAPGVDPSTDAILGEVYSVFGQYSAWKLREMTHCEDPWKNTARSCVIEKDAIRDYFLREYIEE